MASDKFLDTSFALGMEILEFMHSRELLDIQTIGSHNIWIWNAYGDGFCKKWGFSIYSSCSDICAEKHMCESQQVFSQMYSASSDILENIIDECI